MKRILAVLLMAVPVLSEADTVTFQDGFNGYTGEKDTIIGSQVPSNNSSSLTIDATGRFFSNLDRTLMRFDLSSFSGQSGTVTQVTLTLDFVSYTGSGAQPGNTINLEEVNAANAGWVNTTATWNTYDGVNAWSGGGGLGDTGFGPVLDSESWTPATTTLTFTITGAAARSLINDFTSGNNPGFILTSTNETTTDIIQTDNDNDAPADSPQMTVTYAPAPEPSTALLLVGGLGMLCQRRTRKQGIVPTWKLARQ